MAFTRRAPRPPRRRRGPTGILVLVVVAAVELLSPRLLTRRSRSSTAFGVGEVDRIARTAFENLPGGCSRLRPNYTKVAIGPLEADALIRDRDTWQLQLAERDQKPVAYLSKMGSNETTFSVDYDSAASHLSPPFGIPRLAIAAAGKKLDPAAIDWALAVEGGKGRHLAVTTDGDEMVYDASAGFELPLPAGARVRYAVDSKRRPSEVDQGGFMPTLLRQSFGLFIPTRAGDLQAAQYQHNDGQPVYFTKFQSNALPIPGSPSTAVQAEFKDDGVPLEVVSTIDVEGPMGTTGSIRMAANKDSSMPSISGAGSVSKRLSVAPGLHVNATTGIDVDSKGQGTLRPLDVSTSADFATLMPGLADAGSSGKVDLHFAPGKAKPETVSASVNLNVPGQRKRPSFISLSWPPFQFKSSFASRRRTEKKPPWSATFKATGIMTNKEEQSGAISVVGELAAGLSGRFEASSRNLMQLAEIAYSPPTQYPVDLAPGRGRAAAFARALKKGRHEKPRVQLGLQYHFGDRDALSGENVLYDSGGEILQPGGAAIGDHYAAAMKKKESILSEGIDDASISGAGRRWLLS